jgi:diadenylate cyclase
MDQATGTLSALEIEDRVTIRDVASIAQGLEMASRIANEINGYMIELGTDSGLLSLQLEELTAGSNQERELFLRDYAPAGAPDALAQRSARLSELSADELLDLSVVAAAVRLGAANDLDQGVTPRGYRLLGRIPRLPSSVAANLIEHFGGLQEVLSASVHELRQVPGVDAGLASQTREGLSRLAESALLDRYP